MYKCFFGQSKAFDKWLLNPDNISNKLRNAVKASKSNILKQHKRDITEGIGHIWVSHKVQTKKFADEQCKRTQTGRRPNSSVLFGNANLVQGKSANNSFIAVIVSVWKVFD